MVDVATISAIVGLAASSVGLIDKITDSYLKFWGRDSGVPKEHRSKIVAGEDGKSLIRLVHGQEAQRVTYQEMTKRLSEDDLSYIRALEKSMKTHKSVWEGAYPQLASEVNPVAKAKIKAQLDDVAEDMGKDLQKILTFVEKTGLYLDDHYYAISSIANGSF